MTPAKMLMMALTLAVATTPVVVSAQSGPSEDPLAIQPGNYKLDSTHARILFSVSHFGFSTWYGEFPHATATATFDPNNVSGNSVDITIPVTEISTSNSKLDQELKGADWFDVEKYPSITYKSKKVTSIGPDTLEVVGDLTMHGVTRLVTLNVKFNACGVNMMNHTFTAGYDATAKIHRSDFGVLKFAPMIGDEVNIIISAPFEKVK